MRRMFGFLIGIFAGALVGGVMALLLAPESGEQLRGQPQALLLHQRPLHPVADGDRRGVDRCRLGLGTGVCAAGLPAGQQLPDHFHPCALRQYRHERLSGPGHVRGHQPGVEGEDRRDGGAGHRFAGCLVLFSGLAHRRGLGQADLGYLLGLGRAPDLHADGKPCREHSPHGPTTANRGAITYPT